MLTGLLAQGDSVYRTIQVTGEEGVTLSDYVVYQKALLLDMLFLQPDAYDAVDVSISLERQRDAFRLVRALIACDYPFEAKEAARMFFMKLTGLTKDLNYSPYDTAEYAAKRAEIDELVRTLGRSPEGARDAATPKRTTEQTAAAAA